MATFDQLSPEQRAIVELVLRQGKTYSELADMLNMPEPRIRSLARDALVELAPVSVRGVEEDWRGQLADYVLGQQSGPEATATKGHLRRSEAARSWTRSLLDSLAQFYEDGSVPAIPEGERGRAARRAAAPAKPTGEPRLQPSSFGAGFFGALGATGAAIAAGALVLLLLAILVWPVGVLTGDDDGGDESADTAEPAQSTGQGEQAANGQPAGIAIVVQQGGKKQLLVQAARLAPSGQSEGYYVWLYNSQGDAKSLGGQITDEEGNYQAIGRLPADFRDYRFIDVTRQAVGQDANVRHSGESVLRGAMPKLRKVQSRNNQPASLGQTVLRPPS
jgi:hypothetical protein